MKVAYAIRGKLVIFKNSRKVVMILNAQRARVFIISQSYNAM